MIQGATIGPTGSEADFVAHIEQAVASDPAAPWVSKGKRHTPEQIISFCSQLKNCPSLI